jgi:hypothetical protein
MLEGRRVRLFLVFKTKEHLFLVAILGSVLLVSGCAKPNSVETFKSPVNGVFYTVETFHGVGLASDYIRVYAHLERNGASKKILVLDGDNLTIAKIIWNNPHESTFCLQGGITSTFRNEVTLIVGDSPEASETIYSHLQEHCDAVSESITSE